MSSEPNFSVNFTAVMLATDGCARGNCLVFNSGSGVWRVASATNRTSANARTQAIALTAYGGSAVGTVSYQSSGVLAAEVSGLPPDSVEKLVRCSAAGVIERVSSYSAGDDIVGYAEPDGRVHLHLGIPWSLINSVGGAPGLPLKSIQYNNGGVIAGTSWLYEGSNTVQQPAESKILCQSVTQPAKNIVVMGEHDATGGVGGVADGAALLFGTDLLGSVNSMPVSNFFWAEFAAGTGAGAGLGDCVMTAMAPGAYGRTTGKGVWIYPNILFWPSLADSFEYSNATNGGGTGCIYIGSASVKPSGSNGQTGVNIFVDGTGTTTLTKKNAYYLRNDARVAPMFALRGTKSIVLAGPASAYTVIVDYLDYLCLAFSGLTNEGATITMPRPADATEDYWIMVENRSDGILGFKSDSGQSGNNVASLSFARTTEADVSNIDGTGNVHQYRALLYVTHNGCYLMPGMSV